MTSEQSRPAGSEHGDGAAGTPAQGGQPSPPPVGRVRASASVPLPTRTPGAVSPDDEQAPPDPARPGPFPPSGPTPPRAAPMASGKASVPPPGPPAAYGSPPPPPAPAYGSPPPPPVGPSGSFPGFASPRADDQPGAAPSSPGYAGRAQVSAPPAGAGRAQVSVPPGGGAAQSPPYGGPPQSAPPYPGPPQSAPPYPGSPQSAPPYGSPPPYAAPQYSGSPQSEPPYPGSPQSAPPYGDPPPYAAPPYPGSPQSAPPYPAPPYPGSPQSAPPYPAPPYPGSPATGMMPASGPPATGMMPASGFQVSASPTSYGGSPHYSDLVNSPGEGMPPGVPLGPPESGDPNALPPRKSRRALVLSLVVVAVVFLLAVAGTGIVVALNNAGNTTFAVNSCVKQNGEQAVKANCSDSGAFTVVSKVDKQESCPDPNQPFVVLQHKGSKDEVLCLRPTAQK